jgi:hypothetical protein|tara:strand:- start:277 stop:579 length:303 start_codon:yes stop_codon:yes gene_type:complete
MKYPKFIIEGTSLVIGKAELHVDMSSVEDDVISGGWYIIDTEKKELHLYGKSYGFGRFTPEQVLECTTIGTRHNTDNLNDYKIFYSRESYTDKEELIKGE